MTEQSFFLDGVEIPFEPGDTLIQAAARAGVDIPHLCHHPDFAPHGSCKLCVVRVDGRLTGACHQPAAAGARVENRGFLLDAYRRRLLQMLFVEGNHHCSFCEKSGDCRLQYEAYRLDMEDMHYPLRRPTRPLDASHPRAVIDYDRCILCELCVRASREVDGKDVFGLSGRGLQTRLTVNSGSGLLADTGFDAGDLAARVCPVGAILPKGPAYLTPIGRRTYDRQPPEGDPSGGDPSGGDPSGGDPSGGAPSGNAPPAP